MIKIHRSYQQHSFKVLRVLSTTLLSRGVGLFGALGRGGDLSDSDDFKSVNLHGFIPKKVSAGWGHSVVLTECGKVLLFGRPFDFSVLLRLNVFSELGFPGVGRWASSLTLWLSDNKKYSGLYATPIPLSELMSQGLDNVVDIHASAGLTVGLTKTGQVFTFGLNRWGQCGAPSKGMHHYTLAYVSLPPVTKVDVGLQHCLALTSTGKVYGWGKGDRGQLGDSPEIIDRNDKPIRIDVREKAIDVSVGFNHSAILTADGEVYIWGRGMSDILKKSDEEAEIYNDQYIPRKVTVPGNKKVIEICSSNFTLVVRCEDGGLWALGLGERDRIAIPNFISVYAFESDDQLILDDKSVLIKGHQRITVLHSSGAISQILVHGREAYVKSDLDTLQEVVAACADKIVVDLSTGWKHDLLILREKQPI